MKSRGNARRQMPDAIRRCSSEETPQSMMVLTTASRVAEKAETPPHACMGSSRDRLRMLDTLAEAAAKVSRSRARKVGSPNDLPPS